MGAFTKFFSRKRNIAAVAVLAVAISVGAVVLILGMRQESDTSASVGVSNKQEAALTGDRSYRAVAVYSDPVASSADLNEFVKNEKNKSPGVVIHEVSYGVAKGNKLVPMRFSVSSGTSFESVVFEQDSNALPFVQVKEPAEGCTHLAVQVDHVVFVEIPESKNVTDFMNQAEINVRGNNKTCELQ